jgi:hypothetical protein
MTELLLYPDAVDNDGNVVHVDDLRDDSHRFSEEADGLPLFQTGPITPETLAMDSLADALTLRAANRLDSMAHHPATSSGESAELAGSVQLGKVAQSLLDAYREATDRFNSAKGSHYRDLMIGLAKAQARRTVTREEAGAIIALVSETVVVQTGAEHSSDDSEPLYNSWQDAAANDRNDKD